MLVRDGQRAILVFGAAGMFSEALIIIAHSSPVHKRPIYAGIAGAMYGIASVVGPLIGGAFIDKVTWCWYFRLSESGCPSILTTENRCFWITLSIRSITAVLIVLYLHLKSQSRTQSNLGFGQTIWQIDPIGTILFVPSIVCLLLALQWGSTTYTWSDNRVVALLVLSAVLLILFVGDQVWMGDMATIQLRIVSQRTIAFSCLFSIFIEAAFFLLAYFLPIWFQAIKGTDALHSGIDSIPLIFTMTVGIILSGGLTTKFTYYMSYVYSSVVLTPAGTELITTFQPNTKTGKWIDYQIIFDFTCGLGFQVPQIAILTLPDVAQGVAITFFVRNFWWRSLH